MTYFYTVHSLKF